MPGHLAALRAFASDVDYGIAAHTAFFVHVTDPRLIVLPPGLGALRQRRPIFR